MAKRTSSRLAHNRNLNNEIEAEIEKNEYDEAKNPVDDPPAGSRKRKKGSIRDEPEPETQIDGPAQSLPATSKNRLLHLLDKHIQKKKTRRSSAGPPKSTVQNIPIPIVLNQTEVQDQLDVQENQVDYSIFEVDDLVKMVSEVGVDTRGMEKLDLIRNCEKFRDLIITPQHPRIDHVERDIPKSVASKGKGDQVTEQPQSNPIETSTSAFPSPANENSSNTQSNRTIASSKAESSRTKKKQAGPENLATEQAQSITIESSSSALPTQEHKKSSNIQSRRTIQFSNAQSQSSRNKKKGRERAREETEDDYEEELVSESNHDTNHESDNTVEISHEFKKRDSKKKKSKRTEEEYLDHSDLDNRSKEKSKECKKGICLVTSQKVEKLAQEVKYLTGVVENLVGKCGETMVKKKTRGGRTAVHIRFHVDVMLGRKSETSPPPPPASTEEKEKWMYDKDIDAINIDISDVPQHSGNQNASDTSDLSLDGPGHPDATPQQLAVITKLMNSVGIESFRPNFSESAQSHENKWLWEVSEKIFIKLVGYGEYPGVSLDTENRQYIKKCFATYFQTLKKRYRKEQWDQERQKAADDTNRRTTRLGRLRNARRNIVTSHRSLWPLLPLIESTCSDDETDPESASLDTAPGDQTPIHVRHLKWRSENLLNIYKRLDESQIRFKKSLTGSATSSPRGRRARPRIRVQNPPSTKIPVPDNLPRDCYSNEFWNSLAAKEKAQINIDNQPILPAICKALDELGF